MVRCYPPAYMNECIVSNSSLGWGQYLSGDVSIAVQNSATSGRSARSYTREGRFQKVANSLKKGDHVVLEFGHNDGGKLGKNDNGRTDCAGTGSETCQTTYDGKAETVLTFPAYIEKAVALFRQKGAHVLVSSQTPDNPWETGKFIDQPTRFVEYAELAANVSGAEYVDHFAYTNAIFKQLGNETVNSFYPENQHTHTNAQGAKVVAQAFLKGVVCSNVTLSSFVTAKSLPGECL